MKKVWFVPLVILLGLALVACGDKEANDQSGQAVAIVNGTEISKQELDKHVSQLKLSYTQLGITFEGKEGESMLEELEREVLQALIDQELLLQAAESEGYQVDSEEVEQAIEEIKSQFANETEFEETLESVGFTLETLRQEVAQELLINQFLGDQIGQVEISPEEAEEAYLSYEEETGEKLDEETKQMINQQLIWQKEGELKEELVERLRNESDIEILL